MCTVTFRVHPSQKAFKTVSILDVEYDSHLEITGYLKSDGKGWYHLISKDHHYSTFLVRDITIFDSIKDPREEDDYYSILKRSQIDPKYLQSHFFKARFYAWPCSQQYPLCVVTEELGPIMIEANFKRVSIIEKGITSLTYPKAALTQAKKIQSEFQKTLKSESKYRQ